LMILTNAGGPGVLATDSLLGGGGELADLSEPTQKALDEFLPPHWSHANPVDILGDADPQRYARALEIAIKDPNSDGLLVVLAPQGMTDPAEVAQSLTPHAHAHGKPLLASWMGGREVAKSVEILNAAGVPTFSYPDTAARAFDSMWSYTYHLKGLYETPSIADDVADLDTRRQKANGLLERILASGRTLLKSKLNLKLAAAKVTSSAARCCARTWTSGCRGVIVDCSAWKNGIGQIISQVGGQLVFSKRLEPRIVTKRVCEPYNEVRA
jgi:acetyltransferase